MRLPTKRQLRVLDYIKRFIESRGYPPTVREISDALGCRSPCGAMTHLLALARKGVIGYGGKARAITINPEWK
jgi:repressor LexA